MFEKISNPDWKIAVKKPDFVRADVFELCLIIADLWGIYRTLHIKLPLRKYFQGYRGIYPVWKCDFCTREGRPFFFRTFFMDFDRPWGSVCCVVLYIMPAFLAIYGNLHCTVFITFFCTCDNILPVTSSTVYLLMVVETDGHQVWFIVRSTLG